MNEFVHMITQAFDQVMLLVRMPYDIADAMGMLAAALPSMQLLVLVLAGVLFVVNVVFSLFGGKPVAVIRAIIQLGIAVALIGIPVLNGSGGFQGLWYMLVAWAGWAINPHIGSVALSAIIGLVILIVCGAGFIGAACIPAGGSSKNRNRNQNANNNANGNM